MALYLLSRFRPFRYLAFIYAEEEVEPADSALLLYASVVFPSYVRIASMLLCASDLLLLKLLGSLRCDVLVSLSLAKIIAYLSVSVE